MRALLEKGIRSCRLCRYVDKPFLKSSAYDWLPERVGVLAVGESPPPGKKEGSLYNLEVFDRLRLSLSFILGVEMGRVLETLREAGVFFTASVKCRPPDRKSLAWMRRNCVPKLAEEIRLLAPQRIVAMGRLASSSVCEILNLPPPPSLDEISASRRQGVEIFFTPHPNYVFRFARNLASQLSRILLGY
jgi:uracil-DNA glycosylase family 4